MQLDLQLHTYSKQVTIAEPLPLAVAVPGDSARGGQTADSVGEGERQVQKASGGGWT